MAKFVMVHDLPDPDDEKGRSYKEVNADKTHTFSVGDFVEMAESGERLYVAECGRDCDMTPLYWLAPKDYVEQILDGTYNLKDRYSRLRVPLCGGICEKSLILVERKK